MRTPPSSVLAVAWLAACAPSASDERTEIVSQNAKAAESAKAPPARVLDAARSLAVTDAPILARFSFERVLAQLATQSGVQGATALSLFRQLWDTQNPVGASHGPGDHCDDEVDANGRGMRFGFPYDCRPTPAEGSEATSNPFAPEDSDASYMPIGLFNRFDLAPADGSHCGEYRVVFARRSGVTADRRRNLLIFETALPNPHPQQGLSGCKKVAELWADLSDEDDMEARAETLERFYFEGLPPFAPVIHVDHLGGGPGGAGQLRTNQFMQAGIVGRAAWSMREFHLVRATGEAGTTLRWEPRTVKGNPFGPLFSPSAEHARKERFWQHLPSQVPSLAADALEALAFDVPDEFNAGQSQFPTTSEDKYLEQFGSAPSALRASLTSAIAALSGPAKNLTPENIVARAQALSCAGCHRLSNAADLGNGLTWPSSIDFVHVSETQAEVGADGVTRFRLSPALKTVFLPHRLQILNDFVTKGKVPKTKSPRHPIGGRAVH